MRGAFSKITGRERYTNYRNRYQRSTTSTATPQSANGSSANLTLTTPLASLGVWATAALLAFSAPAATVAPGAIAAQATAAVLTTSAASPGVGVGAGAANPTFTAPAATITPGTVSLQANAALLTTSAPAAAPGLAANATPTLVLSAPDASTTQSGGAQTADAGAGVLTASAPTATAQPGAVTADATVATIGLSAPDASAFVPGPAQNVAADAAIAELVAPNATADHDFESGSGAPWAYAQPPAPHKPADTPKPVNRPQPHAVTAGSAALSIAAPDGSAVMTEVRSDDGWIVHDVGWPDFF